MTQGLPSTWKVYGREGVLVPLAPQLQQKLHRLLRKMLVMVSLGPFQIPAVIPRDRLTKGIEHLDDPPFVCIGGSIHHLSLLFVDSSAGCFCLLA